MGGCFPRTRFPPHTRGCTAFYFRCPARHAVSPAHAGMYPSRDIEGNPVFVSPAHAGMYRRGGAFILFLGGVSPAHAGMYRSA